jgi:hypothetical protein
MIMGDLRRFQQILIVSTLIFVSCAAGGCGSLAGSGGPPGEASIAGSVIDAATKHPVAGAVVALEQPDSNGIDRIVASTTSSADGTFSFGILPQGDYDIVADATVSSAGSAVTYAATITFGVPLNSSVPDIPIEPEYGNSSPAGSPAQVSATVVSAGTLGVPVPVDVKLSALQPGPSGRAASEVTVPPLAGSTPTVTTLANLACESGTACANYSLLIPAAALSYGTFNASGTQYTLVSQGGPEEVVLTFEGKAFTHGNGSVADCTPASESAFPITVRGTLASIVPNLAFSGCS